MNVTCPECRTVYRVDPQKVPAGGVRARCARCPAEFAVTGPSDPDVGQPVTPEAVSGLQAEAVPFTGTDALAESGEHEVAAAAMADAYSADPADGASDEQGLADAQPGYAASGGPYTEGATESVDSTTDYAGPGIHDADVGHPEVNGWSESAEPAAPEHSDELVDEQYQEAAAEVEPVAGLTGYETSIGAYEDPVEEPAPASEAASYEEPPRADLSGDGSDDQTPPPADDDSSEYQTDPAVRARIEYEFNAVAAMESEESGESAVEPESESTYQSSDANDVHDVRFGTETPYGAGDDLDRSNAAAEVQGERPYESEPIGEPQPDESAVDSAADEEAFAASGAVEEVVEDRVQADVRNREDVDTVSVSSESDLTAVTGGGEGFAEVSRGSDADLELPPPPFGASDPHARAKRLARALVSDIVVYHPDRRERSLRAGTIRQEFREEIRKSWDEYVAHVGNQMARDTSYFRDALNELLAEDSSVF